MLEFSGTRVIYFQNVLNNTTYCPIEAARMAESRILHCSVFVPST